jgi:hypothetical protein
VALPEIASRYPYTVILYVPGIVLVGVSYLVIPDYCTRYYCSKNLKLVGCVWRVDCQGRHKGTGASCHIRSRHNRRPLTAITSRYTRVQVLVIHHSRERMEVAVHYVSHTIARAPLKQQCRTSRSGRQDVMIPVTQCSRYDILLFSTSSCSIRQRQLHWRAQPPWGQRWHHQESMPPFPHH